MKSHSGKPIRYVKAKETQQKTPRIEEKKSMTAQ
jgi:hypothetical protein